MQVDRVGGHIIDVSCVSLILTRTVLGLAETVQAASVAQIMAAACECVSLTSLVMTWWL